MITIREKTIDEKIAEIEEKYRLKLEAQESLITKIIAADGVNQTTKIEQAQIEYNSLSNQKDLEILEILGGA